MPADTASAEPLLKIRFDPVTDGHADLLHSWLSTPHVSRWWGDPDVELALIRDGQASGESDGYVFSFEGRPTGYIQSWLPQAAEEQWGRPLGEATRGIDMFIGEAEMTGRGIGPQVIAAFAARLFEAGARRVVIDPDARNTAAIRAYQKAGFVAFDRYTGNGETDILMELPAPAHTSEKG